MDYVCRITRSYNDISGLILDWSTTCEKLLVYQHPAGKSARTGKTQKEHCHFLIQGCKIGLEGLKKRSKPIIKLSGNEDWSFSDKNYTDSEKYITYMTKGRYSPVFIKNYEVTQLDQLKNAWIEPVRVETPQLISPAPPPKDTVVSIWAEYLVYMEKWFKPLIAKDVSLGITQFQRKARLFWYNQSEHHLFPPGSQQKRFLTSIYYHYKVLQSNVIDPTVFIESDETSEILNSLT